MFIGISQIYLPDENYSIDSDLYNLFNCTDWNSKSKFHNNLVLIKYDSNYKDIILNGSNSFVIINS